MRMVYKGDHPDDTRGLIYESYRIDGIKPGECRSIFLDWALGLAPGRSPADAITALLERYAAANPAHPMTEVLRAGLETPKHPKRRGGAMGRAR